MAYVKDIIDRAKKEQAEMNRLRAYYQRKADECSEQVNKIAEEIIEFEKMQLVEQGK